MPVPDPTPAIAYASLNTGSEDVSSALAYANQPASPSPNIPHSDNPQSKGEDPVGLRDDNPQSSDPVSQAFAPLFAAPERHPGGPYTMPPIPREARTRAASCERQNYIVCRCELILVDWIDRFAYTGLCGSHDLQTFERATMILWRLTSIRKSLDARSADPSAPDDSAKLDADLHAAMTEIASLGSPTGSADVSSAYAPAAQSVPPSPDNVNSSPGTADGLVRNPAPADQPAPPSPTNDEHQTTDEKPSVALSSSAAPCVPPTSVRAVPSCPTLSPQRLETFLARTQSDIASLIPGSADALVRHPANAHQPAAPSSNVPNASSTLDIGPLTLDNSNSNPQPQCPNPIPNRTCADCDARNCPARIAAPARLPNLLRCSHFCRECRKAKSCPYTLPRYRASPS